MAMMFVSTSVSDVYPLSSILSPNLLDAKNGIKWLATGHIPKIELHGDVVWQCHHGWVLSNESSNYKLSRGWSLTQRRPKHKPKRLTSGLKVNHHMGDVSKVGIPQIPTIKKNSQAIFGTNSWSAAPLTTDHKPTQFHPSRSKKGMKFLLSTQTTKNTKTSAWLKRTTTIPNNKKTMSSLFPMFFLNQLFVKKSGSPARATKSGKAQVGEIPTFHLPSWGSWVEVSELLMSRSLEVIFFFGRGAGGS